MRTIGFRIAIGFALVLASCLASCSPGIFGTSPSHTPIAGTGFIITAEVGTVEPVFSTPFPPDYTPPPTPVPPTLTPIPTLSTAMGPIELKYRVLDRFPDLFFCDPDYYPIPREDEMDLARLRYPEIQANPEELDAILVHLDLNEVSTFTDEQILLIYREHKRLAAVPFELTGDAYQFQIQVARTEGEGELIKGTIDGRGKIIVLEKTDSFATCPICLAAGTQIDTPSGPVAVEDVRPGMLVWTMDAGGNRVAQPVIRLGKTVVPVDHQVIHLALEDGQEVWVSAGHPLPDGRRASELRAGDVLDGGMVLSVERVRYAGTATYDLLPAGETGFYWANGILLASSLK